MLWWAFDESYEHSPETGHATRVTVGGSVGSCDEWLKLDAEWRAVLARFDLTAFHMTDFEANEEKFKGWEETPDRRRELLNGLLATIDGHLGNFLGVTRELEPGEKNETEAYRLCVTDVIADLARYRSRIFEDQFALVFARRRGFRLDLAEEAIEREGAEKFGPIILDSPTRLCALQAADLIAYETSRIQRAGRPERYPFRRLREAALRSGGFFSLVSR
jgi:hypothetical protein